MNAKVAANWNELPPNQFAQIAAHLNNYGGIALKAHITWTLLDLSWRSPRKLACFFFGLNAEGRHRLTALANPFLQPTGLLETVLPSVKSGRGTLPCIVRDLLNELDVETWGIADACFLRYNKTREPMHLQRMAAVLYCAPGTLRSFRLNPRDMKPYERIPMAQLLALHVMWSGHRKVIEAESQKPFKQNEQKKVVRRKAGWNDVLHSMAGGKFGPWEQTLRTPARQFMYALHQAMVLDEKREQEARKRRR